MAVARGAETADEVIGNADLAMYQAKHAGRGRYEVFEPAMRAEVHARLALRSDLERGLTAGEFVPYYEPVVDLALRCVVGVEALVRWHHPERGVLTPDAFMDVAEQTGAVIGIGHALLRQVCRDVGQWHNEFDVPLRAGVILSAAELADPGCSTVSVWSSTRRDGSAASADRDRRRRARRRRGATSDTLAFLTALGARVVVDGFGTGPASLAPLEVYPVHAVKIAEAFTERLGDDTAESPMVGGIIALGRSLGLHVSAQGVTNAAAAARLRELGCAFAQGPYFAAPRPAEMIPPLLVPGGLAERIAGHEDHAWEPIDAPPRTTQ